MDYFRSVLGYSTEAQRDEERKNRKRANNKMIRVKKAKEFARTVLRENKYEVQNLSKNPSAFKRLKTFFSKNKDSLELSPSDALAIPVTDADVLDTTTYTNAELYKIIHDYNFCNSLMLADSYSTLSALEISKMSMDKKKKWAKERDTGYNNHQCEKAYDEYEEMEKINNSIFDVGRGRRKTKKRIKNDIKKHIKKRVTKHIKKRVTKHIKKRVKNAIKKYI